MNRRMIDWIWHVRGSLALAPRQSSDDVFDRLDPLFRQTGTSFERTDDTLVFRKKRQAAQDRMSVFDGGVLRIEKDASASVLRYHLISRALLYCFLAPILFLGIAQFTIALGELEKPSAEAADKSGKNLASSKKDATKEANMTLNPIDQFLGAPAPEKPKKEDEDKGKEKKKKYSPTSAYVFAAMFAILYIVGRILEDRLVKIRFRKHLLGS